MKRNAPLRSRKFLRRRSPMRTRRGSTKYSRRERDLEFMKWARRQPCIVRELAPALFMIPDNLRRAVDIRDYVATACTGHVEADHLGDRGLSHKADDRTCAPMCSKHHRERTDHTGTFRPLTKDELRAWRTRAIEITQAAWSKR